MIAIRYRGSVAFGVFLAAAAAAITIAVMPAKSYTLSGYYWPGGISGLSVCQSTIWSVDSDAWTNALSGWYNTSTPFWYSYSCGAGSQMFISDTYDSGVMWDGMTHIDQHSGNQLIHTQSYLNNYYTDPMNNIYEEQSVASHEIGHILGLSDQSGARVMNGVTCGTGGNGRFCYYTIWGPVTDDVDGINAIY